jgi:hypothetical protein
LVHHPKPAKRCSLFQAESFRLSDELQLKKMAKNGNQAIMELGPPDKSAKLADGTVVADWLTHHAQIIVAPEPCFAPPGCYFGPLTPMRTETYVPAQYLRLTFGADGKLKTWKEVAG